LKDSLTFSKTSLKFIRMWQSLDVQMEVITLITLMIMVIIDIYVFYVHPTNLRLAPRSLIEEDEDLNLD
jgi:hypothetical protein